MKRSVKICLLHPLRSYCTLQMKGLYKIYCTILIFSSLLTASWRYVEIVVSISLE